MLSQRIARLFRTGGRKKTKQFFGDEFKFVLNDYPDVCKFALHQSDVKTVKLRIYKVFEQDKSHNPFRENNFFKQSPNSSTGPQIVWKESNILEDLFEVESSEEVKKDAA